MACIIKKSRSRKADVFYIKQSFVESGGKRFQRLIPCKDASEARELLPKVKEYEEKKLPYELFKPAEYKSPASKAMHYGELKAEYFDLTVHELMGKYLEHAAQLGELRPNTLKIKRGLIKSYVDPFIGKTKVKDITTPYIQDFLDDLPGFPASQGNHITAKPKVSYRTVMEVKKVLSKAFKYAVRLRAIESSPVSSAIEIPRYKALKREQWTEDELITAISYDEDPQLQLAIMLTAAGPLRTGELLGLCWDCIHVPEDLSEDSPAWIDVKRELQRIRSADLSATGTKPYISFPAISVGSESQLYIVEYTKTSRSKRSIYLPLSVALKLKAYRERQEDLKYLYGEKYQDFGLVFAQEARFPGRPVTDSALTHAFKAFIRRHSLRSVTFYSIRGTGTTQKMRATSNPKLVQADMGGDTVKVMMEHYVAAEDKDRKALASAMESRLFNRAAGLRKAGESG